MSTFDVNFWMGRNSTEAIGVDSLGVAVITNATDQDYIMKIEDINPVTNPPDSFIFQIFVDSNELIEVTLDGIVGTLTIDNGCSIGLYFTVYPL